MPQCFSLTAQVRQIVSSSDMLPTLRPHDAGLWLAIAQLKTWTPQELALARYTMEERSAPRWARLAAATALVPTNPNAKAFVGGALKSFLSTFGQTDIQTIFEQAKLRPLEKEDPAKAPRFRPTV